MDYALSAEQFLHGKMFDSKGQFSHKTGNRFKLFPFAMGTCNMLPKKVTCYH